MIGIYKITNIINNKCYIGKSSNVEERIKRHIYYLSNNKHHNTHLQASYNKYGVENFAFSLLEECCADELNNKEIYYIDKFNAYDGGYNQTLGGEGVGEGKFNHRYNSTLHTFYHKSGIIEKDVTVNYMFKKYNLEKTNIRSVALGLVPSCKGWRLTAGRVTKIKKYSFINTVTNKEENNITITQMSEKYNLHKSSLRKLTRFVQHKCGDWKLN